MCLQKGGKRHKVETADGNFIDTLFVDNRGSGTSEGRTLVICCEGNAGYYEVGILSTPLQLGYSVLGWNHPGLCLVFTVELREKEFFSGFGARLAAIIIEDQ